MSRACDRLDASVEVAGMGTVLIDVAYGGMFYAIVDATKLGFRVDATEARELAVAGEQDPAGRSRATGGRPPRKLGDSGHLDRSARSSLRRHRQSDTQHAYRRTWPVRSEPDRHGHVLHEWPFFTPAARWPSAIR